MPDVKVIINGTEILVDSSFTILEAAKKANVIIPTLCYFPDQKVKGSCRICLVEVEGQNTFAAACCTPVREGLVVKTNTERIREARRNILQLIMANHNQDCLTCPRNGNCELQTLCKQLNVENVPFENCVEKLPIDTSNPSIVRDMSKCIKCGRCVEACHDVQGVGAIYNINRSCDMKIAPPLGKKLSDAKCVYCGQCINVCPVGAIYEKDDTEKVWASLADESKHVIVQIAPAIRVSIGEEFNLKPGTILTPQIVAFFKRIGFDKVFDTNFTADLTILEEGTEFIERLKNKENLPMMTSCSPGWIRFIESFYPDMLSNLSSCKSPQQMFGALAKSYYAKKYNLNPKDIVVVSVMPCTAKKAEAERDEMQNNGYKDVDIVITTRELAKMIRESGINFESLKGEEFDELFGISTGAAVLFGATGGVMEAALRTVYEVITGSSLNAIDFYELRGMAGVKEATVKIDNLEVKVAVVNGLSNAKKLLDLIKEGKAKYDFIEVMCCEGGCIGGGGQPIPATKAIKEERIKAIYNVDSETTLRKSHENPVIKTLYKEFLGTPLSLVSHKYLHTHYEDKSNL